MGLNTVVLILNDHLKEIEDNCCVFTTDLKSAIHEGKVTEDVKAGSSCNAVTVLKTKHADISQLVMSGKNWINSFDHDYIDYLNSRGQLLLIKERVKEAKLILKQASKYIKELEGKK